MTTEEFNRITSAYTAEEVDANPALSAMFSLMWDSIPAWERPDWR